MFKKYTFKEKSILKNIIKGGVIINLLLNNYILDYVNINKIVIGNCLVLLFILIEEIKKEEF